MNDLHLDLATDEARDETADALAQLTRTIRANAEGSLERAEHQDLADLEGSLRYWRGLDAAWTELAAIAAVTVAAIEQPRRTRLT